MAKEFDEGRKAIMTDEKTVDSTLSDENKKEKAKIKEKSQNALSGLASVSFFIALVDWLWELVYNALVNGLFGKIFASYSTIQAGFSKGVLGKLARGKYGLRRFLKKIRRFLAENIEAGFFSRASKRAIKYSVSLPLSSYGNFFLFFGVYTIVVYFIKLLVPGVQNAGTDYLITGIITAVVSVPMMFSRAAVSTCVKKSVIGKMIFQGAFGFSDELFSVTNTKVKGKGNLMLVLGLVVGLLTFFVHPLNIIFAVFAVIVLCIIATAPEVGVILTIILIPILSFVKYPTIALCVLIFITAFFYLLKLIRGKRVFRLEVVDAFVVLFGFIIMFSNIFSAGREEGTKSVLVTCTLLVGYFLLVNLMRTEKWIKRCIYAMVGSAAFVSVIGIGEFILGTKSSDSTWLDASLFSDIKLRVVSLFENPNVLSVFLVIIFPLALALRIISTKNNEKLLSTLICALIILCTVLTWSRGAWLGLLIGAVIFFIMYSKKTIRFFGLLLLLIPFSPMLIPSSVLNRFLSITNLADSSISYRLYTWKGTISMIGKYLWGGIGFGNEAFQNVYPHYAYAGMETAQHSHSLFLQILAGTGIVGLIVFAIVMLLSFQKCFEYIKSPENKQSRVFVSAVISALVSALVMGMFDYIWYNYRVFYIFWVILAVGCAFVRVGNSEILRKQANPEDYSY